MPDDAKLSEQLTRLADQVVKGIELINGPIVTEVRTNTIMVSNLQGTVQGLSKEMKETLQTVNQQNLKLATIEKDVEQIKEWVENQEAESKEKQKESAKVSEEQRAGRQRLYITIGLILVGYLVQVLVWLANGQHMSSGGTK